MTNSLPAIVLTGTIVPNVVTQLQHCDPMVRKNEYLAAIKFYAQFAPVYFLENSTYDLLNDQDFNSIPHVLIRKFPVSEFAAKGRGFQEFEMLDRWVKSENNPPERWLKITGRYLYQNITEILAECSSKKDCDLLINQHRFSGVAESAIFGISHIFYQNQISGLFQECDDGSGWFIEKALHRRLCNVSASTCQRFKSNLVCIGVAGFNGLAIQNSWRDNINKLLFSINYTFDRKYIWLSV
jgi:hypothetical protein